MSINGVNSLNCRGPMSAAVRQLNCPDECGRHKLLVPTPMGGHRVHSRRLGAAQWRGARSERVDCCCGSRRSIVGMP